MTGSQEKRLGSNPWPWGHGSWRRRKSQASMSIRTRSLLDKKYHSLSKQHFLKLYTRYFNCQRTGKIGRFEPRPSGCVEQTLPLCHAAPFWTKVMKPLFKIFAESKSPSINEAQESSNCSRVFEKLIFFWNVKTEIDGYLFGTLNVKVNSSETR